jgi:hypothetical protein
MPNRDNPKRMPIGEKPEKTSPKKPSDKGQFERERIQFRALILANPNYFGNLKNSKFKPKLNIQSNTFYEEIGCVGF